MKNNLEIFPILPLRDIVAFPRIVTPLLVGRDKSLHALEKLSDFHGKVVLVTQIDPDQQNINTEEVYKVGVLANVVQMLKLPDGTVRILAESEQRVNILQFIDEGTYTTVKISKINTIKGLPFEMEALMRSVSEALSQYATLSNKISPDNLAIIANLADPELFADTITAQIPIKLASKQAVLEEADLSKRLELLLIILNSEIEISKADQNIKERMKKQVEKRNRDFYLNEQMDAIKKELTGPDQKSDNDELENRLKKVKLSKEAKEKLQAEIKKLKMMQPLSAEAGVVRNYIETILDLPWGIRSKIKKDLNQAQKTLDNDHYGLEKIKERILEYLAVQQRVGKIKAQILCFVGPPGVGKTSLGKSIAKATGREFVRFALGGVRDEAEIRGHRRTYIGAMPGKIIQLIKKSKKSNPVFLLDEIDKMSLSDFRGDPAAALLEVLDPEQNAQFVDHYLEVEYDLSDVMFIATANSMNIPRALMDRMEIIRLDGYTEDEKYEIATKYIITKQLKEHGLTKNEWTIDDESLYEVIRFYTRESGVRTLEKELAKLMRKAVRKIGVGKDALKSIKVNTKNLEEFLGVHKYDFGKAELDNQIGVSTGLAYTESGGDLLSIESVVIPGKGEIKATGTLGDVMKESAQAAFSFFKSRSDLYGVNADYIQTKDIHLHVPEGATPKDGPSAGVAIFTSIVSAMTSIPIRKDVAMTGEITLRGRVLPIGGLKEKLLAALRGHIKIVMIPKENKKDLAELPKKILNSLDIRLISTASEALDVALTSTKFSQVGKDKTA